MKTVTLFLTLLLLTSVLFSAYATNDNKATATPISKTKNTALLLTSFGSTWENSHQTYQEIKEIFEQTYPQTDVYLSFTSKICISRWGAQTGEYYATPDVYLETIAEAGYENVWVQSLHIIPGKEYTMLKEHYVKDFKQKHPNISTILGEPLLVTDKDIEEVGSILYQDYKSAIEQGEAVVFMGHGSPDSYYDYANVSYRKMHEYLQSLSPLFFVGTVDYSEMLIDFVMKEMAQKTPPNATIHLAPLMSIAGDHAHNDIAGDYDEEAAPEEQSWKIVLRNAKYSVPDENCHLKGLGGYSDIIKVWIRHLNEAIEL